MCNTVSWRPEMASNDQHKADAQQLAADALIDRLAAHSTPVRLRIAALTLALSAHAALLYALASPLADTLTGGGGRQLDAISVTIVSAAALESLVADPAHPPVPSAGTGMVDASEGATETTTSPEQHDQEKEAVEQQSPPPPVENEAVVAPPREDQKQDRRETSTATPAGGGRFARRRTQRRTSTHAGSGHRRRRA